MVLSFVFNDCFDWRGEQPIRGWSWCMDIVLFSCIFLWYHCYDSVGSLVSVALMTVTDEVMCEDCISLFRLTLRLGLNLDFCPKPESLEKHINVHQGQDSLGSLLKRPLGKWQLIKIKINFEILFQLLNHFLFQEI